MITLSQFVEKYNGKKVDFDGVYGGQCQDLYRQYVQECLGFPQSPGVVGAKDNWDVYLQDYYERIPNTPDGVPQPGDIMIWGSKYGPYGHVAIVISANSSSFTCFSQNDPTGSLCVIKKYTAWSTLMGWFHPKLKSLIYRGYDLNNYDSMKIAVDKLVDIMEGKYISINDHNKIINELDSKSTESAQSYAKDKQILEEKIRTLEEVIKQIQESEHSWSDTADVLQRKLKAVLFEFEKIGITISIESDEDVLVSSVSKYLSSTPTDQTVLIEKLNKQILDLKKKDPAYKTINLGSYVIKIYKK